MSDILKTLTPDLELPIFVPPVINVLPDEYVNKKLADEEKIGGTGAQYSVPFSTYIAFKNAVLNHGYDIDGYYGWQCWDGAALLWQQMGLALATGNGLAIGCWDLKRDQNKYNKFDLVTDVSKLQLGDVVVMRPNHIGFFDGFDGAYMRILGQNQGGTKGPNGGMAFNLARIAKTAFAGAFRLKQWEGEPIVKPTKNEIDNAFNLLGIPDATPNKDKNYDYYMARDRGVLWTNVANALYARNRDLKKQLAAATTPPPAKVDKAAVLDYINKNTK